MVLNITMYVTDLPPEQPVGATERGSETVEQKRTPSPWGPETFVKPGSLDRDLADHRCWNFLVFFGHMTAGFCILGLISVVFFPLQVMPAQAMLNEAVFSIVGVAFPIWSFVVAGLFLGALLAFSADYVQARAMNKEELFNAIFESEDQNEEDRCEYSYVSFERNLSFMWDAFCHPSHNHSDVHEDCPSRYKKEGFTPS